MKSALPSLIRTLPVLLAAAALASCASASSGPAAATAGNGAAAAPAPTPAPATPLDPGFTLRLAPGKPGAATPMVAAVRRVMPAVVAVNVLRITYQSLDRQKDQLGSGSGFIIDPGGLVVTNNHVVEGSHDITVSLGDGRTFPAKQVVTDPVSDLAVIRIDGSGLPAVTMADSSRLEPGQQVAVIGNALARGNSVNGGWVSRLGVSAHPSLSDTLYGLIQTDAAINPGNSGGPLIDMDGNVVGIADATLVAKNVWGVGFVISTQTAAPIIQELVRTGTVRRAWIGVVLQTVNQGVDDLFQLAVNHGALVTRVHAGSPAAQAGLVQGDVIVRYRGQEVHTASDLAEAIRTSPVGQPASIDYWHGQIERFVHVTPREDPKS